MASRACNTASVLDVSKCIRANISHFEPVSTIDPEKVTEQFQSFICDLLTITPRPLKPVLSKSLKKAFEGVTKQQSDQWAGLIIAAVAHCRYKSKSFSSGAKTSPAVTAVIQKLLAIASPEKALQQPSLPVSNSVRKKLWRGARPSPKKTPKKSPKKSPNKTPKKVAPSSAREILQSYDELLGDSPVTSSASSVVAVSDEEAAAPASSSQGPAGQTLQYFDQELLKMKKVSADGQIVLAEMAKGPSGFLQYQWPGTSEWHESEIPNLVLASTSKKPTMRKPAASKKRPAAAMTPEPAQVEEVSLVADGDAAAAAPPGEPALHNVRFTQASKPPRTYIQACACGGPGPHKLRLIVEYSDRRDGPLHLKKAEAAKEYIIQHKLSYSQAREIRTLFPQ